MNWIVVLTRGVKKPTLNNEKLTQSNKVKKAIKEIGETPQKHAKI